LDTTEPIVPTEAPDNRRELLSQQFDEVAQAEPAKFERDDAGKFASNNDKTIEEPVEEPVWKRAPASWKKDYHDVWQTADPRMQEYAWQREEQMRKGVEPLISKAQFADQISEVVNPYLQTIQGMGLDTPKAIKALLEADQMLRTSNGQEKLQLFGRLAQQYGVNLNEVNFPQGVDPTIYALQNELNNVRGEVNGWKQQQEQAQNQQLLGEIEKFSSKAEHFEEARPTMIQLLQSGVAQTLEDAYEKAVRLDPELFDSVQISKQAELDNAKRVAADRAAKSARANAVSVKSSTPGMATKNNTQDRRSLLAEQFDQITARL
jgi:hypothetical protein